MKLLSIVFVISISYFTASCSYFSKKEATKEVVEEKKEAKNSDSESVDMADKGDSNTSDKNKEKKEEKGFFSSITSILPGGEKEEVKDTSEDSKLQIARLMARVEQLSTHVIRMQSRLVVLEKSVHLGISPESLNSKIVKDSSRSVMAPPSVSVDTAPRQTVNSPVHSSSEVKSSKFDEYQQDLNRAISLFNKGEYGSAYVSFNNIEASYTENVKQGIPQYWIGRSWYRLREYQSAKKNFQAFIRKYPTSVNAPMGKYYLAKIDVAMGLPGSAIALLQEVIREHPSGNAADASRKLIGEMNNSL